MALSKNELLLALSNEETRYAEILPQLNEQAIEYLSEWAKGKDVMLATKAIYLAGLYNKPSGHAIVESAAKSTVLLKRIAVASVLGNLSEAPRDKIGEKLITDEDISIQKLSIRAVGNSKSVKIKQKLNKLSKESKSAFIREIIKALPEPLP